MKVSINLPDWCDERDVFIIAGCELVAFKRQGEGGFHIKTERCNYCGRCCDGLKNWVYPVDANGSCSNLEPDGPGRRSCHLYAERPLPCIIGDPVMGQQKDAKSICSIRYDNDV